MNRNRDRDEGINAMRSLVYGIPAAFVCWVAIISFAAWVIA